MPVCTMPSIPCFRKWYNEQFKDLCEQHDYCYANQYPKKDADIDLMIGIMQRGYVWLGIITYICVRSFGVYNYWQAGKKKI